MNKQLRIHLMRQHGIGAADYRNKIIGLSEPAEFDSP